MRQLSIGVLLGLGLTTVEAAPIHMTSADTSAEIAPLIARGPGPVVNPENSQFMEDKNAAIKATNQVNHEAKPARHQGKKQHNTKQ
ncbi:hypothetical protein J1780_04740 [Rahnella aceris]|uniref:hypothetical protein n=1 Tax=Rahnella sp. (strain Y9602) TaxID=2703885 RepID=UPI001C274B83|nr:hypothetical protein [Rahnella aceris]MBU9839261.1 hypothetical protein [Rahnella aceris]